MERAVDVRPRKDIEKLMINLSRIFFIWRNVRNRPHITAHAPGCCSTLRVYLHDVKWTEKKKESKSISDWRKFSVIVTHYGGWSSPISITLPPSHRKRTSNFFISIFCEFNREEIDIKNHDFLCSWMGSKASFIRSIVVPSIRESISLF